MKLIVAAARPCCCCTRLSAPSGASIPHFSPSICAPLPQFLPPSVPSSVDAYLSVCPGPLGYSAHYATWQSAVLGFASVPALRALRAARAAGRPEGGAAAPLPPPRPQGPKPRPPSGIEYIKHPAVRSFSVPFPGDDVGHDLTLPSPWDATCLSPHRLWALLHYLSQCTK